MIKEKSEKLVSWRHPGGKLLRKGSDSLSDVELIAVLIGSGVPGKSAINIASDIFAQFQSFRGMAGKSIENFKKIKGLKTVKIVRIMAAFEIAKRIVEQVLEEQQDE
ncbi:hypothetical protein A2160_01265 [Candidatus Beckwithbacteria bacterium RBG_13_42_9]|uniref:UPF0758 domain-containing protein n=1 Tax=Candidatus Beckwithbacteria bacterium RBG_13_42_9 TaxID=1797457 RepID=A0A1F5E471_9BACT|nr:MAG: hypothetical protein A2160_01265 [Candidatus Beckwithbacteria bacterium RBG_13_42_9]